MSDIALEKMWGRFCNTRRYEAAAKTNWYVMDTVDVTADYAVFLRDLAQGVPRAKAFAVEFATYRLKG